MAILRIPEEDKTFQQVSELRSELAAIGIDYERWDLSRVGEGSSAEDVLAAYVDEIEEMKRRGGYVVADVIDITPGMPNLESMLARFDKEHTHSEDEVRFVLSGRGIFFLNPAGKVYSIEVHAGDMIRVPRDTPHWFTLCEDRRIRAIRWFQETAGWTPHYTGTGTDAGYEPLCFGPAYLGPRVRASVIV